MRISDTERDADLFANYEFLPWMEGQMRCVLCHRENCDGACAANTYVRLMTEANKPPAIREADERQARSEVGLALLVALCFAFLLGVVIGGNL